MDAMQLSLSVRIAETPQRKDCAAMAFEPLMQLAATLGYKGISMRASQASIDTPAAQVAAMKQLLDELGLAVSMCTGTVGLAATTTGDGTAARHHAASRLGRAVRVRSRARDD